jgi:hypothetical protein
MRGICAVFKKYKHHFIDDACIVSSTLASSLTDEPQQPITCRNEQCLPDTFI